MRSVYRAASLLVIAACAKPAVVDAPPSEMSPEPSARSVGANDRSPPVTPRPHREPVRPPAIARLAGLLPLGSIGIDTFRLRYPEYDGRGVIIGILDSGVDPGVPGLQQTTTGRRKLLDVRDFSGEGRIALRPVRPRRADTVDVGGHRLSGFGRFARMASAPYFGGVVRERSFGAGPAADLNGDGRDDGTFPIVVAKSSGGWLAITDSDGDRQLSDETPLRDFAVAGETFTYRPVPNGSEPGPMTIAVNLQEEEGRPLLDLFFDNSSHGTHVAGIAAGRNMFGVDGFDGVAPGAQILALKISDNSRGAISVTGSMVRAMNYAADYAEERNLPLVLNLSFGIGNEIEGSAALDSIVNNFALRYPDVLFVISAGNDGPGLSTVWFPGSAEHALSVCALFPGAFAERPGAALGSEQDLVGWWSARGGEVLKPDVCAPGVAFSNVPPWRTGEEISIGTSMAAPQIAGAAAVLQSAMHARGLTLRAIDVARALTNTARMPEGATRLDVGAGVPDVTAAYRWLLAAHQAGVYAVRALATGGNTSKGNAAFRRSGLVSPADTIQSFTVASVSGQPAARLLLTSDADWIRTPAAVDLQGEPVTITVTYDASRLRVPGAYVGSVIARAASDTFAGPSFVLGNTVIVPHSLVSPFQTRRSLSAGRLERYFFSVPDGAGGLVARVALTNDAQHGTMYLFEPNGQPHRGVANVAVGGSERSAATLQLAAQDLVPGVYEVVVVAPPSRDVEYDLRVSLPGVAVVAIGAGPRAFIRNTSDRSLSTTVSARIVGQEASFEVEGRGSDPRLIHVEPPERAREMVIDVQLTRDHWHAVSDFGLTVFDSSGVKLSDGSLRYAFHRHHVPLDSIDRATPLAIELLPAYAHTESSAPWSARVRVAFLEPEVPLPMVDGGLESELFLGAGASESVLFESIPWEAAPAPGYETLIEVSARTATGPSIRHGPTGSPSSDGGQP